MPGLVHFLLVYSYGEQRLLDKREFTNAAEAAQAYRATEALYRGRADEFEIVLVGADSIDTVMRTHGHYFLEPSALPALDLFFTDAELAATSHDQP